MGITQFLGDIEGDIKTCEGDVEQSWGNFTAAFSALHKPSSMLSNLQMYQSSADFNFNTDPTAIKTGIRDIGSVSYTHLRAHETVLDLVCRLLLENKKKYI
eukprot:TRINITY_DN24278_c0_g1_i1.p2 TRINITY_DN24278_c0_g1~~TRINITY_DN24278_c0_g1_i1.p2  ORF type:complete len:101 (+),score=35.49 TRINITY_DN24278_c0_g1_i1:236-538(+)